MPDARGLQINFPVKSAAVAPVLVLPRRRKNSRAPFAAPTGAELTPPPLPTEITNPAVVPAQDENQRVEEARLKEWEGALREKEAQLVARERALPDPAVLAAREEGLRSEDARLKDMERVLREQESRLSDRERGAVEQEKRLAQRERDLVQAEPALLSAVEALQKIKSALHARAD